MNNRDNLIAIDTPIRKKQIKKTAPKFTHSLEYEVIANLVLQQYEKDENVRFELLLSIPATDRIPALVSEYGKKRMYRLLNTLLKEFCISIPLPKSKKLNDTRINICTCDLMISAVEDELSIEDFILFFERAKKGRYGSIKKYLTHQLIKEKLEMYLGERQQAFIKISEQRNNALKLLGTIERTCDEPKQIGELLKEASVISMNRRMSG